MKTSTPHPWRRWARTLLVGTASIALIGTGSVGAAATPGIDTADPVPPAVTLLPEAEHDSTLDDLGSPEEDPGTDQSPADETAPQAETADAATDTGQPLAEETTASITGTVIRGDTGEPVEDVSITADAGVDGWGTARTQADGSYVIDGLDPASYVLDYRPSGDELARQYFDGAYTFSGATQLTVEAGETLSGIDVALDPAGSISGTVIGADTGEPVEGLWVTAEGAGLGYGTATTDENGDYTVAGLAPHAYEVVFETGGVDFVREFWESTHDRAEATPVQVNPGQDTPEIDAALSTGGSITGTVTRNDTGEPVSGVTVQPETLNGSPTLSRATTGEDGTFTVTGLAEGEYRVQFLTSWNSDLAVEFWDGAYERESASSVSVELGQTTSDIDATLAAGADITGTVTAEAPNPGFNWATVIAHRLVGDDWQVEAFGQAWVGDDYTLSDTLGNGPLPPGEYKIEFFYDGYCSVFWDSQISLDDADSFELAAGDTREGIDAHFTEQCDLTEVTIDGLQEEYQAGDITDLTAVQTPDTGEDHWHWFIQREGENEFSEIPGALTENLRYEIGEADHDAQIKAVLFDHHHGMLAESDPVTLNVASASPEPGQNLTIEGVAGHYHQGGSIDLNAVADPEVENAGYEWFVQRTDQDEPVQLEGEDGDAVSITAEQALDDARITANVLDTDGEVLASADAVVIDVDDHGDPPHQKLTVTGAEDEYGAGDTVSLAAGVDPASVLDRYEWEVQPAGEDEWTTVEGANAADHVFEAAEELDGTQVRAALTFEDGRQYVVSEPVTLLVADGVGNDDGGGSDADESADADESSDGSERLAATGAELSGLALGGAALLLMGAASVLAARRRAVGAGR